MDSIETLRDHDQPVEEEIMPCRNPNCSRVFKYRKCRINHEQTKHQLFAEEQASSIDDPKESKDLAAEDHIFNYGCLHLSLGLLLRDAEDAVKEGDGRRLIRVWKFLTFLYRLKGANKYALAGLRLQASVLGLLTPREAHRLTESICWQENRTWKKDRERLAAGTVEQDFEGTNKSTWLPEHQQVWKRPLNLLEPWRRLSRGQGWILI